jgi:hypothetical protein
MTRHRQDHIEVERFCAKSAAARRQVAFARDSAGTVDNQK